MRTFWYIFMIILWTFNGVGVMLSKEKDLEFCKVMYFLLYVSFLLTIVGNYFKIGG